MDKLQVIDLFGIIKRTYPSFDVSAQSVEHYAKYLSDYPYEVAVENVEKHILTERFPPTIAEIRGRLGDMLEGQRSREAAAEYLTKLEEWDRAATPPPDEIRRIMRLPEAERREALKQYAKRRDDAKRHEPTA